MHKGVLVAAVWAATLAPVSLHAHDVPKRVPVIALPERTTVLHVGDVVLVPLYDARTGASESGDALRKIGTRKIARRDLRRDIGAPNGRTPAYQIPEAAGDRAEAFVAMQPGRAAASILLSLPQYPERCVSCRTLHYFFQINR